MEYKVIQVRAGSALEEELSKAVAEGWKLHSFQVSTTPGKTSTSSPRVTIIAVMEKASRTTVRPA